MSSQNIVLLLFSAIIIAILVVMQYRHPTMPLVNFFAGVICIVILAGLTLTEITFGWYGAIIFVILLTAGAVIMNRKVSVAS